MVKSKTEPKENREYIRQMNSVEERIRMGFYNNTDEYPREDRELLKQELEATKKTFVGTLAEINTELEKVEKRYKDRQKVAERKYREKTGELHQEFKEDLEEEFGVKENPKKDLLYSHAWDRGHSSGLMDVYINYSDLVELIR